MLLPMKDGFRLLEKYGIPTAKFELCRDAGAAAKAAARIGYPVALKLDSPDIIHKTEKGAVIPNIKDEKALRAAVAVLLRRAGKAKVRGIIVQEHCGGKEIIIGGTDDPQFGDVVLFGLGGVFVEVLKDFSVRVTPIARRDAESMVKEIRGYAILAGARGEKPVNIKAIADTLLKVSRMVEKERRIKELDINPLFVDEHGVKAVDVRVITY